MNINDRITDYVKSKYAEKKIQKHIKDFIREVKPLETQSGLIRLGPNGDGGYLVPDDLGDIEACFSPGVCDISEFEMDCHRKGMKLFLADKSVEKPNLDIDEEEYEFLKKFIGTENNDEFITLEKWVEDANINADSDLLLQMDIEGAEYESIIHTPAEFFQRFRIMVVEFHSLDYIFRTDFLEKVQKTFKKLLKYHEVVHIHPNNNSGTLTRLGIEVPRVMEFTFYRKDRAFSGKKPTAFPHPLDFDNIESKPSLPLPKIWYKQ